MSNNPLLFLKEQLNQIITFIPSHSEIAYLDYPVYANIGDILIMKGTERFFTDNKLNVTFRSSNVGFNYKRKFSRNTILVLQGGGNFGDLYPEFQNFRESIIQKYKNNRIIILPQTIFFKKQANLERAAAVCSQHPDLHIFLRDKHSMQFSKESIHPNSYLLPDMSHALYPITSNRPNGINWLYLLRTDNERCNEANCHPQEGDLTTDWFQILSLWEKIKVFTIIGFHLLNKTGNILPAQSLWYRLTDELIEKVIALFLKHSTIVTSRLHGHILACLLEMPNILLDNSYAKNKWYYDTWTLKVSYSSFNNNPIKPD